MGGLFPIKGGLSEGKKTGCPFVPSQMPDGLGLADPISDIKFKPLVRLSAEEIFNSLLAVAKN